MIMMNGYTKQRQRGRREKRKREKERKKEWKRKSKTTRANSSPPWGNTAACEPLIELWWRCSCSNTDRREHHLNRSRVVSFRVPNRRRGLTLLLVTEEITADDEEEEDEEDEAKRKEEGEEERAEAEEDDDDEDNDDGLMLDDEADDEEGREWVWKQSINIKNERTRSEARSEREGKRCWMIVMSSDSDREWMKSWEKWL